MRHKKVIIDSKEIKYLIVEPTGRIIESGEKEGENDTFENSFVNMEKLEVGKKINISFNKGIYERRSVPKEAVWVDLLYDVISIEE